MNEIQEKQRQEFKDQKRWVMYLLKSWESTNEEEIKNGDIKKIKGYEWYKKQKDFFCGN